MVQLKPATMLSRAWAAYVCEGASRGGNGVMVMLQVVW